MINPSEFKERTRCQWEEFEWYKELAFKQTPEELELQEKQYKEYLINTTKQKLSEYGIEFTWEEKDFKKLWKQYIQWDKKSEVNKPMNEWLGKDERLQEIVDLKWKENNNLKDFCSFVLQYES
jgi:hypothetical protein